MKGLGKSYTKWLGEFEYKSRGTIASDDDGAEIGDGFTINQSTQEMRGNMQTTGTKTADGWAQGVDDYKDLSEKIRQDLVAWHAITGEKLSEGGDLTIAHQKIKEEHRATEVAAFEDEGDE